MTAPQDAQLMLSFQRDGDRAALACLVERNGGALLRFLVRLSRNPAIRGIAGFGLAPEVYLPLSPRLFPSIDRPRAAVVQLVGRLKGAQTVDEVFIDRYGDEAARGE